MIELSTADVIAIILGLIALIISIVAFFRANPQATPVALDSEVVRRLEEKQRDREFMDKLERAYASTNANNKYAFDTLVSLLRVIAPQTAGKADDAALALLLDAQMPGEPEAAG